MRFVRPRDDLGRVAAARHDQIPRAVRTVDARQPLVVLAGARIRRLADVKSHRIGTSVSALNCPTTSGTTHEAGRWACAGTAAPTVAARAIVGERDNRRSNITLSFD